MPISHLNALCSELLALVLYDLGIRLLLNVDDIAVRAAEPHTELQHMSIWKDSVNVMPQCPLQSPAGYCSV